MHLRILPLILVFGFQAGLIEPATGYWYEGVVTHRQGTATVASNEPRPLRQAVEALAEEYGWAVDYEDPAYSANEGVERTDPEFVASHPGQKQHLVGGHQFRSDFPENAHTRSSSGEEQAVLQKVIADYNSSGNPGKFNVLDEGGGRFAVVGTTVGPSQTPVGVMDLPITVDSKSTNGAWALNKICESLTASSGTPVRLLQYRLNAFVQTQIALRVENQPARDVLRTVLAQASQKLVWSLLYDIDDKTYYLNLTPVFKVKGGNAGLLNLLPPKLMEDEPQEE
jgi:hypothetical protein